MSILDFIATKPALSGFKPASPEDLIGLRIAQKLGEPAAATHYARLASEHSPELLSAAYRRAVNGGAHLGDVARRFHLELENLNQIGDHRNDERLLAIKVERRAIAIAVFDGNRVDFHDTRNLSSQAGKAEASAMGFLSWVIESFQIQSATLERMNAVGQEIRRNLLNSSVVNLLRANGIPVWEVSKDDLFAAYGYPSLRTRAELRQAAQSVLWSGLDNNNPDLHELDAAALGLHIQIERLFHY